MSTKTMLIVYLTAALLLGGLLYWRHCALRICEREFDQLARLLEATVTECLQEYEACNSDANPERAVERLLQQYMREGVLDYMDEDYETLETFIDQMAYLTIPGERTRLLDCHERLVLLDRALDACNFPDFCKGLAAWTPGPDGFFYALHGARKRE